MRDAGRNVLHFFRYVVSAYILSKLAGEDKKELDFAI